jgi:hypothetical protein
MSISNEQIMATVFTHRNRGEQQNHTPVLFTDFDEKNLRVFEVMPPADTKNWNSQAAWSISERKMTDEEFSEIKAKSGFRPVGTEVSNPAGGSVRVNGFVKRYPLGWTVSVDTEEAKETKGEGVGMLFKFDAKPSS